MHRRTIVALLFMIAVFAVLRITDLVLTSGGSIEQIETFVASHVRANMVLFASVAVGAYVARTGFMIPALTLVIVVWGVTLLNTYVHRENYLTELRLIDLDWPGAFMAIVSTVVAVKVGHWIRRLVVERGTTET